MEKMFVSGKDGKKHSKGRMVFVLILAVAMLMTGGCGKKTKEPKETKPVTIPVPADGWTAEKLINVTYIQGNRLSYPPTVGDLKENIKIIDEHILEIKNGILVPIYNQNEFPVCNLYCSGATKPSDLKEDTPIREIHLTDAVGIGDEQMSLNGVLMGDSRERVEELLGKPDMEITDRSIKYNLGPDSEMHVIFLKNELYHVYIYNLH